MLKTLVNLGLKQKDAQVYAYLAINGPKRVTDIAKALNTYKLQVYRSLRELQTKEVVNATSNLPAEFYAVSFEKVLDLFMKSATEQAKAFQASRKELLSTWRSMIEKDSANS
jgi:sugar-specific transcriptional regulator TrmB